MNRQTEILFVKYSATGNDFILIDNRKLRLTPDDREFFRSICQRRTSAGADGVLLVENDTEHDFRLRYFNADGSETECGNGARSAAHHACLHHIASDTMTFRFGETVYAAEVKNNRVNLRMPAAKGAREEIGIIKDNGIVEGGFIHIGVPHFVLFADNVADLDILTLGREYRYHAAFQPGGANVDFVEIVGEQEIRLRTYERGVENETLSCGTGCVAASFISHHRHNMKYPISVLTEGGRLRVSQKQDYLYLEGEVKVVYEGNLIFTAGLRSQKKS